MVYPSEWAGGFNIDLQTCVLWAWIRLLETSLCLERELAASKLLFCVELEDHGQITEADGLQKGCHCRCCSILWALMPVASIQHLQLTRKHILAKEDSRIFSVSVFFLCVCAKWFLTFLSIAKVWEWSLNEKLLLSWGTPSSDEHLLRIKQLLIHYTNS